MSGRMQPNLRYYNKIFQEVYGSRISLNRCLGSGAQAVVYSLRGVHGAQVCKIVDVKKVVQNMTQDSPLPPAYFQAEIDRIAGYAENEIKVMQALDSCPNAVGLLDSRRWEDPQDAQHIVYCIRMRRQVPLLLPTAKLALAVKLEGCSPEEFVAFVAEGIVKVILELEKIKTLHRDIRPANIMLDWLDWKTFDSYRYTGRFEITGHPEEQLTVKLSDFGIARRVAEFETGVTAMGSNIAPELLAGGRLVGSESDIYSLSVTMKTLFEILQTTPSAEMTRLLDRMLVSDPRQRATPQQVQTALQQWSPAADVKTAPARASALPQTKTDHMVSLYKEGRLWEARQLAQNLPESKRAHLLLAQAAATPEERARELRKAVQRGSAFGAYQLGLELFPKNSKLAVSLLQLARESGFAPARQTMEALFHGKGAAAGIDFQKAFCRELDQPTLLR